MITLDWDTPPVGIAYEEYTGKAGAYADRTSSSDNWIRGLSNWKSVLLETADANSKFLSTLSTTQRRSLRLLVEWWVAAYEYDELASDYRDHILKDYNAPELDSRDHSKNPEYRLVDLDDVDDYCANLFNLWRLEFLVYEGHVTYNGVQARRALASKVAACQRVAFGALGPVSCDASKGTESTMLHNLEAFDKYLPVGGVLEACPWLPQDQRVGLPYYLWDVANKRTVRTQDLSGQPVYSVISHTWGRWRLKDEPNLDIPGVPWSVPQNSRFAVEDLPNVLVEKSAQFLPATYIWFDLFCIPQDRSALAKDQIAKQAAIFGGAYRAIAWLNYVDDWNGLVLALHYMVSYWLDHEADSRERLGRRILRPRLRKQHEFNAQLWSAFSYNEDCSFREADGQHGWFTSLWTLQELYLRPDMLLADRDWNICHYPSGGRSTPLTIDTLVAVFWGGKPYIIEEACTQGVQGLCALMALTGMEQLLEPHPLSPLLLGSGRQCTGRRAEAIMSVVGARNWYQNDEVANENLIFGHYPIEFLREVHSYLGATFFGAQALVSSISEVVGRRQEVEGGWVPFNAGSMLPFDPWRPGNRMTIHLEALGGSDHPSTATWSIGDAGEVYMTEVAVVASTDDEFGEDNDHDLVALINLPSQSTGVSVPTKGNLHEVLHTFAPSFMKHAVCCRERDGYYEGVILFNIDDVLYTKVGEFTVSRKDNTKRIELQTWDIGQWEVI
ncbi:hypothetical protein CKM354_000775800 [Cercospora kikuchii]|uniref:Heterokaryon incompatibility domain-containing protein n=1 Tax=Cercospora kikuchii TaxID=84275 RepID=A0A9P3CUG7_9PEZI|nr:uncharacterized protein CKM354_000775800 [Cercospora kikuchii]GIZ44563.1 hypothetical protein CKM354_000775800 [Cercospora kikuchii]